MPLFDQDTRRSLEDELFNITMEGRDNLLLGGVTDADVDFALQQASSERFAPGALLGGAILGVHSQQQAQQERFARIGSLLDRDREERTFRQQQLNDAAQRGLQGAQATNLLSQTAERDATRESDIALLDAQAAQARAAGRFNEARAAESRANASRINQAAEVAMESGNLDPLLQRTMGSLEDAYDAVGANENLKSVLRALDRSLSLNIEQMQKTPVGSQARNRLLTDQAALLRRVEDIRHGAVTNATSDPQRPRPSASDINREILGNTTSVGG